MRVDFKLHFLDVPSIGIFGGFKVILSDYFKSLFFSLIESDNFPVINGFQMIHSADYCFFLAVDSLMINLVGNRISWNGSSLFSILQQSCSTAFLP